MSTAEPVLWENASSDNISNSSDFFYNTSVCHWYLTYYYVNFSVYWFVFARFIPFSMALILNGGLFGVVIAARGHRRRHSSGNSGSGPASSGPGLGLDILICNYAVTAFARNVACLAAMIVVLTAILKQSDLSENQIEAWGIAWTVSDGLLDGSHVAFCVFLKPLHYSQLVTRNRCIAVCAMSWLQVLLEVVLTEEVENGGRLTAVIVFEMIPVLFSIGTAVVITAIVYRLNRSDPRLSRFSQYQRKPLWRTALRTFQGPLTATCMYTPAIISNTLRAFIDLGKPIELSCEWRNVVAFLVTELLSNLYLCGIPVAIVAIHPMYWRQVKAILARCRCKKDEQQHQFNNHRPNRRVSSIF